MEITMNREGGLALIVILIFIKFGELLLLIFQESAMV